AVAQVEPASGPSAGMQTIHSYENFNGVIQWETLDPLDQNGSYMGYEAFGPAISTGPGMDNINIASEHGNRHYQFGYRVEDVAGGGGAAGAYNMFLVHDMEVDA